MKRDSAQIERILEELLFIEKATCGMDSYAFLRDEMIQHAVSMALITIGECANHLSETFKEKYAEIEWVQIIAVRNIAAHGYWQLSMEQIWQAVIEDIPKLRNFIESVI